MPTAYTSGLAVLPYTTIRKERRLPIKGAVLVATGQQVTADTPIARAELPGKVHTVKASEKLGVEPSELAHVLRVKVGDQVQAGDLLGETRGLFGLFHSECRAPVAGTVDYISGVSGYLSVSEPPVPLQIDAYMDGVVAELLPDEGAVIESHGALVQGIFGVGGERRGRLTMVASPDAPLTADLISDEHRGHILVGGSQIDRPALDRARQCGVAGLIVGAICDADLRHLVGYDIGVAITGFEDIPFTVIATEGFGVLAMAPHTHALLSSLAGRTASINGATQIRAGVIRPEIVVPREPPSDESQVATAIGTELAVGVRVRIIREPHFGALAEVVALPAELRVIPTGAQVRVAEVRLASGERALVPRANLEISGG